MHVWCSVKILCHLKTGLGHFDGLHLGVRWKDDHIVFFFFFFEKEKVDHIVRQRFHIFFMQDFPHVSTGPACNINDLIMYEWSEESIFYVVK